MNAKLVASRHQFTISLLALFCLLCQYPGLCKSVSSVGCDLLWEMDGLMGCDVSHIKAHHIRIFKLVCQRFFWRGVDGRECFSSEYFFKDLIASLHSYLTVVIFTVSPYYILPISQKSNFISSNFVRTN